MARDYLDYNRMLQAALRSVARQAMERVAADGLRGAHHFYITFKTGFPRVDIPEHLRARFPEEMTIVLQHQFYGLEVDEDHFEVTLSFSKQLERLFVPWAAVSGFVDPSANFGLQFEVEDVPRLAPAPLRPAPVLPADAPPAAPGVQDGDERESEPAPAGEGAPDAATDDGHPAEAEPKAPKTGEVVSLDSFRKR